MSAVEIISQADAQRVLAAAGYAVEQPIDEAGLRLVRASAVRAAPVDWLDQDAIPIGNLTLMAGPPGVAKTTVLCEKAARVSRGQLPGAFHGRPANVVLMSGEDSIENTLRPRCEAAGADLDRVWFVEMGDDGFAVPDDLERLAALIADVGEVAMLGIDPLMAFVADRIDSHKDHHIRRAFAALRSFAHRSDLAVVVVSHLNKGEARDFLARVAGSVGIGAAVRSAWGVVEHPEDPRDRVLVHVKSNLGPEMPSLRFRIEGRTTLAHDGREIDTSGIAWLGEDASITKANVLDGPERATERDEVGEWLRCFLADGPRSASEITKAAKAESIAVITLRRAKDAVGVNVTRRSEVGGRVGEGGWYWSLPDQGDHHQGGAGEHLETRRSTPGSEAETDQDAHLSAPEHVGQGPAAVQTEDSDPFEDLDSYFGAEIIRKDGVK